MIFMIFHISNAKKWLKISHIYCWQTEDDEDELDSQDLSPLFVEIQLDSSFTILAENYAKASLVLSPIQLRMFQKARPFYVYII